MTEALPVYEVEEISIEQALRMLGSAAREASGQARRRGEGGSSAATEIKVQQLVFQKNAVGKELAEFRQVLGQL